MNAPNSSRTHVCVNNNNNNNLWFCVSLWLFWRNTWISHTEILPQRRRCFRWSINTVHTGNTGCSISHFKHVYYYIDTISNFINSILHTCWYGPIFKSLIEIIAHCTEQAMSTRWSLSFQFPVFYRLSPGNEINHCMCFLRQFFTLGKTLLWVNSTLSADSGVHLVRTKCNRSVWY